MRATRAAVLITASVLSVLSVPVASSAVAPRAPLHAPGYGSTVAYRPVQLGRPGSTEPQNEAVAYSGPTLDLAAYPVGPSNLGYEPMVGITPRGDVFYNARYSPGSVAGKNLNEQSMFRSTDQGRHWTDISGGPGPHWLSSDPFLYVDPDTGRVFWLDLTAPCCGAVLSTSDDSGSTWTLSDIHDLGINDRPGLTTARPVAGLTSSDPAFGKLVYYCTNSDAAVECARSDDGGQLFLPVASPLAPMGAIQNGCNGALIGHVSSDRSGRVYLGSAACGPAWVAMSADGGATWQNTVASAQVDAANSLNGNYDVDIAADDAGNVYATWIDNRYSLPWVAVSRDHGLHWGTPLMVAPPGVNAVAYSHVAAGAGGRVALSLVGASGSAHDASRPWVQYLAVSTDLLSAHPQLVAAAVRIPDQKTYTVGRGATGCCSGAHDFLNVVVAPTPGGTVWASLSDTCTGACVTDPSAAGDNSNIGKAYAVREISGPVLRPARAKQDALRR